MKWKLEISIDCSENWVADGFDASTPEWNQSIQEAIENTMPFSYSDEFKVKVKVLTAPSKEKILKIQGH